MNKKLFVELVESMEQMNEIARGERAPSRAFHIKPGIICRWRPKLQVSRKLPVLKSRRANDQQRQFLNAPRWRNCWAAVPFGTGPRRPANLSTVASRR